MAAQRDYYADLELPRDADISDIKKQFRKLALKYHPDRNPGREQEVNAKFQVIQAAHEILSDSSKKAKYDATLGRNRFPGASGVRGNPWADVSAQFPTPPRRTNPGANTTRSTQNSKNAQSGAQRWQSRFSSGVPPTAKQKYGPDAEAKKNAAKAFENMRKNAQKEPRPTEPPPPPPRQPPRTESARQRAEASFGSRKSGYYPRSTMPGDEPPVASHNYSKFERKDVPDHPPSPPQRPGPSPMPDPLSQFRERNSSSTSTKPSPTPTSDQQHQSTKLGDPGMYTGSSSKPRSGATSSSSHVNGGAAQAATPDNTTNDQASNKEEGPSIFSFPVDDDTFRVFGTTSGGHGFKKNSVDDIDTSFVNDEDSKTWHFNAGAGEAEADVGYRSSPCARRNRRSHPGRPTKSTNTASGASQAESGFNAEGWSDKFGPQTFVPQPVPGPSVSPTRASRSNSKRSKAKPAAETPASAEGSSSDEERYDWRGRNAKGQASPMATNSPQAMDIDTPPSEGPRAHAARNIHVEPSRPEWRAGNVDGTSPDEIPQRPAKMPPLKANTIGSEDNEEFRASLADLKNVAPLSRQTDGLDSLSGLKDNLPFQSKASDAHPARLSRAQPLEFPTPPMAPRLHPTVAIEGIRPNAPSWNKYLADFEDYLRQWDVFNGQVVDHFATRKSLVYETRAAKGYGFLGARGDTEMQEYYSWVQQDNDVRQRWMEACTEHQNRMREFMAFRDKMRRVG